MSFLNRHRIALGVGASLALIFVTSLPGLWRRLEIYGAGVHQRAVTRELSAWAGEYSAITNTSSAIAAVDMLQYLSGYYVPGPGYHGPRDVEAALEGQRLETLDRLTTALQGYTGLRHGTDITAWASWAAKTRAQMATSSEPSAPSNRRSAPPSEVERRVGGR